VYGSVARQQADAESDIDLLVLLAQPFNYFEETRQIIDLLYPIQLESEHLISAKPVFLPDYERGRFQLYRTAKKEGVAV
jgi:predicted nucleotidyltransferase